jgi:hypothetical protein
MREGKPLRLARFSGAGVEVRPGEYVRAVLYVPLMLRKVNIGVLGVCTRTKAKNFSERDEFLLVNPG